MVSVPPTTACGKQSSSSCVEEEVYPCEILCVLPGTYQDHCKCDLLSFVYLEDGCVCSVSSQI